MSKRRLHEITICSFLLLSNLFLLKYKYIKGAVNIFFFYLIEKKKKFFYDGTNFLIIFVAIILKITNKTKNIVIATACSFNVYILFFG